jgi:hypothetical protein
VAFLAIQSVDNDGTMVINRSAAQISCYVSMVTSLGSVMLALLLVRQNRSESRQSMEKAVGISFAHFLFIYLFNLNRPFFWEA